MRIAVLLSSLLFGVLHSNVIGLTMFGLVMALLYVRSGSLWLVIIIHSLNNAIAAAVEITLHLAGDTPPQTVDDLRSSIWVGCLLVMLAAPFLSKIIQRNWPSAQTKLPYYQHPHRRSDRR